MKKRVFVYIRVSTQEQADEGYSLGEQEARLRKYCEAMDWILVKVYTDGGFSGANMERPALEAMIKEIKKGEADIVLVDKLDRLSRSQFDTLYLIQKVFNEYNVAFVSRAEAFDTSTPFGRAMVGILAVFAELERERIKERMSEGKEGRIKEGKWKGGNLPTGYDYNPQTGHLVINEYEAEQIRMVIEMFNNRVPIYTIATRMNKAGYRTRTGKWRDTKVRTVVESRTYLGEHLWKGKWVKGGHLPISTVEAWERSQVILEERKKTNENFRLGRKYVSPLSGLIRCGHCGNRYHIRTVKNKDGSRRRYYNCYSRSKANESMILDANCKNHSYRDTVLEDIIFNEIRKLKSEPLYISQLHDSVDYSKLIKAAEDRILNIENQLEKLMDLYSIGQLDLSVVKSKVQSLSEEKKALESEVDNYKGLEVAKLNEEEILDLVSLFEATIASGKTDEINNAIAELIEYIEIDNTDIKIHWNF